MYGGDHREKVTVLVFGFRYLIYTVKNKKKKKNGLTWRIQNKASV